MFLLKTRFLPKTIFFKQNLPKKKDQKMEYLRKTKIKLRLIADFSLDHTGGWGGRIKHNGNDWKFQNYKETNLGYGMICESVNSYQEEKEGDLLNGNRIINLNNLITNIDKMLVCKECAQERDIQIKFKNGKRLGKVH